MGRSRDIADMLGKTELSNPSNAKLITEFSGVDSAYVSTIAAPALVFYSTLDSLPVSGLNVGQQAYVSASNRLYISDGSGWYSKALITLSPTITMDPTGVITLANDGTTTSTVTVVAADSDTPGSGLTYSVDSDGNGIGKYVISQDSSVFTIRPLSLDSGATAGTFALTFSATDGNNIATDSSSFSLTFSNIVDSSAPTVLLMKAAGNSATNADITYQNSSNVSTGFTETGAPAASTFSPYRSGGYSVYFDGTSDRIEMASIGDLSSTNYTIEGWYYFETDPNGATHLLWSLNDENTLGYAQLQTFSGTTTLRLQQRGGSYLSDGTFDFDTNTWYHIATVWDGTNMKVYVNGTEALSSTTNVIQNAGNGLTLNGDGGASYEFAGYIRDFRISTIARYTGSFTPPTEPLTADGNTDTLLCHAPYFRDGSTNNRAVTTFSDISIKPFGPYDYEPWTADAVGGSVYFDNTAGDRILTSATSAIGTSDFTIEAWVYPNSFSTQEPIICCSDDTSGDTNNWYMYLNANGDLVFKYNGSTSVTSTAGTVLNTWNHVAVTATGGTIYLWVNGKTDTNVTYTHNYTDTRIKIGVNRSHTQTFDGYIADARVIIGTAQYTSNFTPPSAPLSHTGSQTTLLMNNKSDANIYDAAAGNTLLLINDTQSSTTQRKFTTSSSVYFDGSGDAIELPGKQDMLTFGTGDFTIECWFRPSVVNRNTAIMDFRPNSTTGSYPFIQPINTNLRMQNVSSGNLEATGVLAANTWIHIAVVRKNGTTTLYTDGVSRDTGADTTDYGCRSVPNIGKHNYSGLDLYGYLQDLRITKGYGRYAANFTPPTAEFEL